MKYRLASLFWLILLAAVSLGWYVDHRSRNRRDIVGTWVYPTPDDAVSGYVTTLEIRSDGTFTKVQAHPFRFVRYNGKYTCDEYGRVEFHVETETVERGLESAPNKGPVTTRTDAFYCCRCAVDKTGYLIIVDVLPGLSDVYDTGIEWETYAPGTSR